MQTVKRVVAASIAAELGIEAGDRLCALNGEPVRDFLDLELGERLEALTLVVEKGDGDLWELEIEKDAEEGLGIALEHPEPKQCGNNCLFCFVHQLPHGMRRSLYIKDEDFRFSYLYGAYVTLSNIAEVDIARIIEQRLSPLYVSVHATDEALRTRLLGRPSPPILPLLERLTRAGIELHTQIVVCPGINDNQALEQTISDLYDLGPGILSLALVPVGLTGHRQRLPALRTPDRDEALGLLSTIDRWQQRACKERGGRFVFAADELYLKAQREVPVLAEYEDLPQIENGVGQIALFRHIAAQVLAEAGPPSRPLTVTTFTGRSFHPELSSFLQRLEALTGCRVDCHVIDNRFFAGEVSVAGLLTGQDIVDQLKGKELGEALLVPDIVLRDGETLFLDDMTLDQLAEQLDVRCVRIPSTPFGILDILEDLADDLV